MPRRGGRLGQLLVCSGACPAYSSLENKRQPQSTCFPGAKREGAAPYGGIRGSKGRGRGRQEPGQLTDRRRERGMPPSTITVAVSTRGNLEQDALLSPFWCIVQSPPRVSRGHEGDRLQLSCKETAQENSRLGAPCAFPLLGEQPFPLESCCSPCHAGFSHCRSHHTGQRNPWDPT